MPIVIMADDGTTTTTSSSSNKNTTSSTGSGSGSSLGSKHRMRTTLYYTAIVIALIATGIHMVTLDEWALVDLSTIGDDTRGMIASTVWKTTTNTTDDNNNNNNRTGSTGKVLSANNKPITTITNKTITTKNGTVAIATTTTTTTVTTTTTMAATAAIASEKNVSSQNATITFLVQLSGEFGNNLQKIIRGWGVAKLAYEEFGIKSHIVYKEQQGRKPGSVILKAKKTTEMIQKCFIKPNFKNANFQLGNDIINVQPNYFNEIIKRNTISFTVSDAYQSTDDIRNNLSILSNYIKKNPQVLLEQQNLNETIYEKENYNGFDWTVSSSPLPGIPKGMVPVGSLKEYIFVNEYYDSMLKTFVFNDEECCGDDTNYPYEDESVLHYRNFATEMKLSRRKSLGFEELDPKRIAYELFGNLNAGDKIAIAGRNIPQDFKNNNTDVYRLVQELEGRNLTVRFAPGKSPVEDFCFLKRAKKELVGTYKSSFVKLASYLGGPSIKLTRLYQYTTFQSSKSDSGLTEHLKQHGNWTHPELLSRIKFELY